MALISDSLDVVGVHLVGGAFGAISLGFLAAYPIVSNQHKGLFYPLAPSGKAHRVPRSPRRARGKS